MSEEPTAAPESFAEHQLGETPDVYALDTSESNREAATALAQQARRTISIATRHLDAPIYDDGGFSTAVRDLILGSRRAEVRVLVKDSTPVLRVGHRLIALAQRLSSFVEIRVPAHQHIDFNRAFMVVDDVGYIHRNFSDRFEATMSFNDSKVARGLLREFNGMWEHAKPDPNLRRLIL